MAGFKMRYKVQNLDTGIIATIAGVQSHVGAKRMYIALQQPPKGTPLCVWQDMHDAAQCGVKVVRKSMRV